MKIPLVDETAQRTVRYAIRSKAGCQEGHDHTALCRKAGCYLATPAGGQDLAFSSTTIVDAAKFATPDDCEKIIEHLFDVPANPMRWDPAKGKQVADDSAPPHLGKFFGQDKGDLEVVATHT